MKIEKKKIILIIGLLLFVGLIVGGTFAYWTWNSTENKSIVFNTVGNVSDYIVYDEGSSYFLGDFKPTDSYCQSVNTTISIKKTAEAETKGIEFIATINMDVNAIGPDIANSSDVYWVVTKGDSSVSCSGGLSASNVLGSGTFFGKTAGENLKLVTDIEVTTTEEEYTIWIWINSNGTDLSKLSGETVDTNIWTQIDMVDPDEENDIENNKDIYTITYNVNGGTNGPENQNLEIGQSATISSVVPTRTGYVFAGWNTIANGSGTSYNAGATYSQDKDLLLYAVWTPNTYTISYNSGGGSGTTSATSCSYGKSCTLRNNAFTKTGYTFIGWTDSESGTNVVYKDGATILLYNKTSNMTLYALWEITTYTVSYDANYGTGEPADQTKTYGETLTLSSVKPTREKYAFVEWNTKADGTGTSYQPGDSYSTEQVLTLYAQWELGGYTISYNANGGSGAPDDQTKTHDVTLTLSSTKPTLTGHTFQSWNTKADGSGTSYSAGGSYTANEGATLYAQWKADTYTVSYNANGGSGAPGNQTKTYGVTLTLSSTKPTRNGYTFKGWSTSSSATSATYSAGGSYTSNAGATLYAVWTAASSQTIYLSGETFYTGGSSNGGNAWVGNDSVCTENYNYVVRYYFTTPASGVRTISSSFTTQGATSGTITSSNFYWYVTTSSSSHLNARTNSYAKTGILSYSSSTKKFTGSNTSVSLAGNTTYYLYVWNACNVQKAWAKWYYNGGSSNAHVIVNG